MSNSDTSNLIGVLALFVVNVYQPCEKTTIIEALKQNPQLAKLSDKTFSQKFEEELKQLITDGYILETSTSEYLATFKGKQTLNQRKIAHPRDKHRLYYLKEAMKKRGKKGEGL